jgi:hypothetical protein
MFVDALLYPSNYPPLQDTWSMSSLDVVVSC